MSVTLYSTRRGLLTAVITPLLLTLLGIWAVASAGLQVVPVLVLLLGAGLLSIALLDYPRRTEFDENGIDRISYLRNHHIPWNRVNALERVPTGRFRRRSVSSAGQRTGSRVAPAGAGLVARIGKRHYLLVNTAESVAEFEQLTRLAAEFATHVAVTATKPSEENLPTDLYRRKRRNG